MSQNIQEHKKASAPAAQEKVELLFPIKVGGVQTSVLTMRRPKVRDIAALSIRNFYDISDEDSRKLIANLCEVAPEDLLDLDFTDWNALQSAFMGMVDFPRQRK